MVGNLAYRIQSVFGVLVITVFAVSLVNSPSVQQLLASLPVLARLPIDPPGTTEGALELATAAVVFVAAFVPLYKPRSLRTLDVVATVQRRVVLGLLSLATIGYFDYTYRLPRLTLLSATPVLLVVLPAWFVWIRPQSSESSSEAIIVGDTLEEIERVAAVAEFDTVGYLCPDGRALSEAFASTASDGGVSADIQRLGDTTRLEDVVTTRGIDTVVLAFQHVGRGEFFSALDTCHRHGVTVKIHRERSDTVLTDNEVDGPLVDVRVEPWDPQDYVFKRLFDIVFAATGLFLTSLLSVVIAVAIKLDSDGPVLFKQPRTTRLGQTFTFYKFRTMVENAEEMTGVTISEEDAGGEDPRVTRVGRVLRRTYLDEIPQLLLILTGEMSVVGPRPAQTEIEHEFQTDHPEWVKRWSVKPGLTGLAQVNDATGLNPAEKLRYDLLYIKRQSLSYDLKLVVRQIRKMFDGLLGR